MASASRRYPGRNFSKVELRPTGRGRRTIYFARPWGIRSRTCDKVGLDLPVGSLPSTSSTCCTGSWVRESTIVTIGEALLRPSRRGRSVVCHNAATVPAKSWISFDEVDLATLRRELEPDRRGTDAGQQGIPRLDAPDDPHERPITDRLQQLIQQAASKLEGLQGVARDQFDQVRRDRPPPPSR